MTVMDAELRFSNAQAVSGVTTTAVLSTNTVDLTQTLRDIGPGRPLYIVSQVTTATMSGAGATVEVRLISDDDPALGSPATAKQLIGIIPATSVVGTRVVAAISPDILLLRYAGIQYTVVGGTLAAGSGFTTFITTDIDAWRAYPDNVTISP